MSDTDCRFREITTSVRSYFFPEMITVPDHVRALLERVYPTVDWERVDFYRGWPHVLRRAGFHAITVPDPHSVDRINVYFTPDAWRPYDRSGVSTIVHEGYHVLQIQEMAGGYGLGLARPFLVAYLAGWAGNGFRYSRHPMEEAAYRVAGRPTALFERNIPAGTAWKEVSVRWGAKFAQERISRPFRQELARSSPGRFSSNTNSSTRNRPFRTVTAAALTSVITGSWAVLWIVVAVFVAAAFVLVDLVGLLVTVVLRVFSPIVCRISRAIGR
jgi:hypothetical protein